MTDPSDPGTGTTVADLVDAVSLRIDLLRELDAAGGPVEKRVLVDRLGVSRSTVDRGLRRLDALGLVAATGEGYATTPSGALVRAEYAAFTDRLGAVLAAQDPVDHLPRDAPLSVAFLVDAEVVTATDGPSHAPGTRVAELVEGADRLSGLARAYATPRAADQFRRAMERGLTVDLVFDREMFEGLVAENDWIGEFLATDRLSAAVHDAVPYGLFLVAEGDELAACMTVYDDDGRLAGTLIADSDRAVEWAEGVVDRYRRESSPHETD